MPYIIPHSKHRGRTKVSNSRRSLGLRCMVVIYLTLLNAGSIRATCVESLEFDKPVSGSYLTITSAFSGGIARIVGARKSGGIVRT